MCIRDSFKIVMIAGGADKKVPFDELGKVICDKVKTLVLLAPEKPVSYTHLKIRIR